ncbi:MAG: PfkB family carbohydrate kinase, partial [Candidatus Omnitrophica bacterium]|nr:PfkB family carbohydrate kinase [Candidatus Omnitrophota bacterium]
MDYKAFISRFKNKRILVIGDAMLDQHIQGSVSRISPEAPVPIVLQQGEPSFAPGGAANVANNLRSLGAKVVLLAKVGRDHEGEIFIKGLKERGISTTGILVDHAPTILKTRIVAQHQQVLRLDREQIEKKVDPNFYKKVSKFLQNQVNNFDAVILSDYGKGMITPPLVEEVCALTRKYKKILTVDPKVEHFAYYRRVTSITPNRKEAENAIRNIKITQEGAHQLGINSDRLETLA